MWVLILVVMTTNSEFIPYEQGLFASWAECYDVKKVVLEEMGEKYRATCLEWK
jgi:hypothetical protein